jgi:hypothetical protein
LRDALKEAREQVATYGYVTVRDRRVRANWATQLLAKIDSALSSEEQP